MVRSSRASHLSCHSAQGRREMRVLALADISKLPASPGVCLFRDQVNGALYVGKSVKLRRWIA